jgi:uncharacterized membrane protein
VSGVEGPDNEEKLQRQTSAIERDVTTRYLWSSECLWFHLSIILIVGTIFSMYFLPSEYPTLFLRGILGSVFTWFLPGYTLIRALCFDKALNTILTVAFSVVLSLVTTYIIGVLINSLFWTIDPDYILASLTIFSLSTAIIGLLRNSSPPKRSRN